MPINDRKLNLAFPAALCVLNAAFRVVRSAESAPSARQSAGKATMQQAKTLEVDLGEKVRIKLIQIPVGAFLMGSPKDEKDRLNNEGPQGQAGVFKPFLSGDRSAVCGCHGDKAQNLKGVQ